MSLFFTADTHFGDAQILRYENRPFSSTEEMDEALTQRWQTLVAPEDIVFHLGDFSAHTAEEDAKILAALPGYKVLVMGNHDRHRSAGEWRQLGFAEAVPWPVLCEGFFLLSHEPLYINRNMPYVNLYGHVHGNPSYRNASTHSVCVCVERTAYEPISLEQVRKQLREFADSR